LNKGKCHRLLLHERQLEGILSPKKKDAQVA
jgi:hypothetical protein